jgi:hypothetical protein
MPGRWIRKELVTIPDDARALPERPGALLRPEDFIINDRYVSVRSRQGFEHAVMHDRIAVDPVGFLQGEDAHVQRLLLEQQSC